MFGLFVASSLAKLGTQRSDSSCKSRQLSWGLPWRLDLAMSHRCAINLIHAVRIRVLILGSTSGGLDMHMTDDIGKLSGLFSLTLLQDLFLHLPAGSRTKWLHFTWW